MNIFKAILLLIPLAAVWACIYLLADKPILFDEDFRLALAKEAGLPDGPIDRNMVKDIKELDLSGYKLTSIEGIEYFTSLEHLNLSSNFISDFSDLVSLDQLATLDISFNHASGQLYLSSPSLIEINVEGNQLDDLSFTKDLPLLEKLNIRDNNISDLSPLADKRGLQYLNARGNQIQSVEPLRNLTQLQDANLRNNQISDPSPLAGLSLNERLYLDGNGIVDYSSLEQIMVKIKDYDFAISPKPPEIYLTEELAGNQFEIEMTASEDSEIYYTINGQVPTLNSPVYTQPFDLQEAFNSINTLLSTERVSIYQDPYSFEKTEVVDALVVRAVSYEDGELSSPVTKTIFLNERPFKSKLPVLSLTTDPSHLFDHVSGIYTPGIYYETQSNPAQRNYFQRGESWERPAHLEFFSPEGTLAFNQNIGIRIHGGFSRALPQKSLRLYSKAEYGQSRFYYPFFEGLSHVDFNRLVLRNTGNDWSKAMMRDSLIHRILRDGNVDIQYSQPSIVYLNGEYWGIHYLRETFGADYLEGKYHVSEEEIVLIESDSSSDTLFGIEEGTQGDLQDYLSMVDYAASNDLNEQHHFDELASRMDISNFLEYMSAQVYFGNRDALYNNTALWKKKANISSGSAGHDGKWRWMLYDADQGFGRNDASFQEGVEYNTLEYFLRDHPSTQLFRSIMKSELGHQMFEDQMEKHMQNEFAADHIISIIDQMEAEISNEIPRHIYRWNNIDSLESWSNEVENLREFARLREKYVKEHLKNHFE